MEQVCLEPGVAMQRSNARKIPRLEDSQPYKAGLSSQDPQWPSVYQDASQMSAATEPLLQCLEDRLGPKQQQCQEIQYERQVERNLLP